MSFIAARIAIRYLDNVPVAPYCSRMSRVTVVETAHFFADSIGGWSALVPRNWTLTTLS